MIRAAFRDPPKRELVNFSLRRPDHRGGVVRRVKLAPGKKLIALTFDLCEEPYEIAGYQGRIVDYLRAKQVKATFFAGGKWMMSHEDRAQQLMSDPLFQIGNHTWEHRNLRLLENAVLADEIRNGQGAYEEMRARLEDRRCARPDREGSVEQNVPARTSIIRFPFGACNPLVLEETYRSGLLPIQWDVSSGDAPPGQSPKAMFNDVVERVRPGSIVLFHANGRGMGTEQAIPSIVEALRAKGYEFATIDELLAAGEPEFASTCYDERVGDTDRYDLFSAHLEAVYQHARQTVGQRPPKDQNLSPAAKGSARTRGLSEQDPE